MSIENDLDLFARVEDGKILEYPVYRIHIRNREHPLHWYTPVIKEEMPYLTIYQTADEVRKLTAEGVLVSYKPRLKNLSELLTMVKEKGYVTSDGVYTPPLIGDIEPELINLIYKSTADYVTEILNNFAAEKNYGSTGMEPFASLMTYYNSKIEQFRAEAVKGADYRDQLWGVMLGYFDKVMKGQVPVPTSIDEVVSQLPVASWD